MIREGKGGAKTQSGLRFEKRIALKDVLKKIKNISVKDDDVLIDKKVVAQLFQKHKLYKNLLEKRNVDYSKILSKKLLPDDAILNLGNNNLYIIEIKFQEVAGSVDEKLQTCDFKNKQYNKLLSPLGIKVKYIYVLNEWFKKPEYDDVLNYITASGCFYFFNEIPLDFLGLTLN
jgi:hypothetical protein